MTVIDQDSLRFLRHILEAYFSMARDTNRLGFPECGRVLRIPEALDNRRVLDLDDDQFLRVDQGYASCRDEILPANCQPPAARLTCGEIVTKEYLSTGSVQQKALQLGFDSGSYSVRVGRYRQGLAYSEVLLYSAMLPELEIWEAEIL